MFRHAAKHVLNNQKILSLIKYGIHWKSDCKYLPRCWILSKITSFILTQKEKEKFDEQNTAFPAFIFLLKCTKYHCTISILNTTFNNKLKGKKHVFWKYTEKHNFSLQSINIFNLLHFPSKAAPPRKKLLPLQLVYTTNHNTKLPTTTTTQTGKLF